MNKLNKQQNEKLEDSYDNGNTDRDSLYSDVRSHKISKSQVAEFLRFKKFDKLKKTNEQFSVEKPKNNKKRELQVPEDDETEETKEEETKPQSKKKHDYNMLTGIYHNKNIDDYELKKINDLSGLAHSLSLIKRNFIEKVATSSHIEDYDEKDSIEHELNKITT